MPRTRTQKDVARELHVNLDDDLTRKYVQQGRSLENIAGIYNVSPVTVSRWLEKLGIPRRPRGRPRKDGTIPAYAIDLRSQ
jgi:transposase